jgi:hypothetical protein
MVNNYIYYYIFNSELPKHIQEELINFYEIDEDSEILNLLPEFSPDDSVLEKIFELL